MHFTKAAAKTQRPHRKWQSFVRYWLDLTTSHT